MGIVDLDLSLVIPLHLRTTKDEHFFHKFPPLPNTSISYTIKLNQKSLRSSISQCIDKNQCQI